MIYHVHNPWMGSRKARLVKVALDVKEPGRKKRMEVYKLDAGGSLPEDVVVVLEKTIVRNGTYIYSWNPVVGAMATGNELVGSTHGVLDVALALKSAGYTIEDH